MPATGAGTAAAPRAATSPPTDDVAPSAPLEKAAQREGARLAWSLWHLGQGAGASALEKGRSMSNEVWQSRQRYSYRGMMYVLCHWFVYTPIVRLMGTGVKENSAQTRGAGPG